MYSVVLSYPEKPEHRTQWHPTSPVGRLSKLVRGAWDTEAEGHEWASKHNIHPDTYEVQEMSDA
jgi:hypothetical protein